MMRNDTITPKELESFLKHVLNFIKESKDSFEGISAGNLKKIQEGIEYINEIKSSILEGVDSRVSNSEVKITDACEKIMKECGEMMAMKPKDGERGADGRNGENGKDGSPDSPKQVRDKLEALEGDERLDISAIKGLEERIKSIPAQAGRSIFGPGKTKVITLDLSSQLNGVLKTFFVGTHFGITGVWGSSSPFAFRPVIDYTEIGKNIVFTDAVEAAISLAEGQSLIIQYLK